MTCYAGGKLVQAPCHYNMPWNYVSGTTDTDPGAGNFKLNNANPALATFAYVSDISQSGIDFSSLLLAYKTGNFIYIRGGVSTIFLFAQISGAAVDGGAYVKLPLTVLDSDAAFQHGYQTQFKLWFPDESGGGGFPTTLCNAPNGDTEYTEAFGSWTQVGTSSMSIPAGTWVVHWQVELQQFFAGDSGECRLRDVTNGITRGLSYCKDVVEGGEDVWSTECGFVCGLLVQANGAAPPWVHQVQFRTVSGFPLVARRARIFRMQTA